MHDFKSYFWPDFLAYCRFLSLGQSACVWRWHVAMCQLLVQQFFNLFYEFKTTRKSHENYVFLYPFSNNFPLKIMNKLYFILVNCMGWQVCISSMSVITYWKHYNIPKKMSKHTARNHRSIIALISMCHMTKRNWEWGLPHFLFSHLVFIPWYFRHHLLQ